jgi:transposase
MAYIFVSKFLDSLPFARQEKRFARLGMEISRANMCNWMIGASGKCQYLLDLMWKEIRSGPFMQIDETGMQVLKEPGRPPGAKGYMFVTNGLTKDGYKPISIYHYHRTRNKKIVADILSGFKGYLQTDGLPIYNDVDLLDGITRVGCGAHIRRNFYDAAELSKKKPGTAHIALSYYRKISKIEDKLRDDESLSNRAFEEKRRELMWPILDEFHAFLIKKQPLVPPESKLGKAINYALKEWESWIRFLDKWFITPDNNYVERKVRDFVIGRRNWTFSDTLRGAHASSTMYTLVQSAKENKINPYWYLRYIFTKLPYTENEEDLRKLLPTEVTDEQLADFQRECV